MCLLQARPLTSIDIDLRCRLFEEIQIFFEGLQKENRFQRLARQDRNKVQIEEYGRLMDEAMLHFNVCVGLSHCPRIRH
jgi:hypothetical protein